MIFLIILVLVIGSLLKLASFLEIRCQFGIVAIECHFFFKFCADLSCRFSWMSFFIGKSRRSLVAHGQCEMLNKQKKNGFAHNKTFTWKKIDFRRMPTFYCRKKTRRSSKWIECKQLTRGPIDNSRHQKKECWSYTKKKRSQCENKLVHDGFAAHLKAIVAECEPMKEIKMRKK